MLAHVISGEQSQPRLLLLRLYARHEVRLLGLFYRLLKSRAIRNRFIKELSYWTLALPAARWGIAGTPLSPDELQSFMAGLPPSRMAVGPCRCRVAHGACEHPTETDIVIKTGYGIWTGLFPDEYREISAEETIEICRDCHEQGISQIAFRHMDIGSNENYFVICNCCPDGCLPLLSLKFYGPDRYPFHKGIRRSFVETEKCRGCGTCVDVCPFGARSLVGGSARVGDCFGCGLCESHCPGGASFMA